MDGKTSKVQYPDVTVRLTGKDGNAFAIIAEVSMGIRRVHGVAASAAWSRQAMGCDSYGSLLGLAVRTVNVE